MTPNSSMLARQIEVDYRKDNGLWQVVITNGLGHRTIIHDIPTKKMAKVSANDILSLIRKTHKIKVNRHSEIIK